jgi:hypothetical protein
VKWTPDSTHVLRNAIEYSGFFSPYGRILIKLPTRHTPAADKITIAVRNDQNGWQTGQVALRRRGTASSKNTTSLHRDVSYGIMI